MTVKSSACVISLGEAEPFLLPECLPRFASTEGGSAGLSPRSAGHERLFGGRVVSGRSPAPLAILTDNRLCLVTTKEMR